MTVDPRDRGRKSPLLLHHETVGSPWRLLRGASCGSERLLDDMRCDLERFFYGQEPSDARRDRSSTTFSRCRQRHHIRIAMPSDREGRRMASLNRLHDAPRLGGKGSRSTRLYLGLRSRPLSRRARTRVEAAVLVPLFRDAPPTLTTDLAPASARRMAAAIWGSSRRVSE